METTRIFSFVRLYFSSARDTWVLEAPNVVWEISRTCVAVYNNKSFLDEARSFDPAPEWA